MRNLTFDSIKKQISSLHQLEFNKETFTRLNNENQLNRRIAVVLSALYDIETIEIRLKRNIFIAQNIQKQIFLRNKKEDKDAIGEIGQKLRNKEEMINRENFLDLKSLYIFIKFFLDDYTELIRFVFNWRDIGDRSITKFYNSLKTYDKNDNEIILFKNKCFNHIEKIISSIVDYRDNGIVHNQQKHKQTTWSISDMRGHVKQVSILNTREEKSSLHQDQLIKIIFEYINISINFIEKNFKSNKNK